MLSNKTEKELKKIVGNSNVSFEAEELLCYSYDATNTTYLPDGVIFPKDATEISKIMKLATSEGFFIIPRGAGSGMTGGSLPTRGGVVLSTERMTSIVQIDSENMQAVVEPGVVTYDLQVAVEKLDLFFPPDPSSLKFSTIGGNIAECAGGPRAVKYGVTRDYVMALEVVLPSGDIINTGVSTVKGVVGYDLTRLMVGSEGTLGIVTKATLKLIPKPRSVATMLGVFNSVDDAAVAVEKIMTSLITPSALELMDEVCVKCLRDISTVEIPEADSLLIVESDGSEETARNDGEALRDIMIEAGASSVKFASSPDEATEIWNTRRQMSQAITKLRPKKLNEDVVVPRARIGDLISGVRAIANKYDVIIASFGHAGDGNIHVNTMYDNKDSDEMARAEKAVVEVFELTLSLKGTLSGEHGVGVTKSPYITMELTPEVVTLMQNIKKIFDPNNILNPGKIFSDDNKVSLIR